MSKVVASFFLILGLSGCGTVYNVSTKSLAAPDALSYTHYYLESSNPAVAREGLEFQAYASILAQALEKKGLQPASHTKDADFRLSLGYYVGKPKVETYTDSVAQYGQTGYVSSKTTTKVSDNKVKSTTEVKPTYGVVGYKPVTRSVTKYPLGITLLASTPESGKKGAKPKQLWETYIYTLSEHSDLRRAFPYLLEAALPYIGQDSRGNVNVQIQEKE